MAGLDVGSVRWQLLALAASKAPEECCGLIARKDGSLRLYEAENAAEDPLHSFAISPREQLDLLAAIDEAGEELVGIYHSHPHSSPLPSETDRAIAELWPGLIWVILGITACPAECFEEPFDPECEQCEGSTFLPALWVGAP